MLAAVAPTMLSWAVGARLCVRVPPGPSVAAATKDWSSFDAAMLSHASMAAQPLHSPRLGCHPVSSMAAESAIKLPLSALSAGITAAIESAAEQEMKDLAAANGNADLRALELDEEELEGRKTRLLNELGDIDAAGLVFNADGSPSPSTFALSLVLTARRAAELDFASVSELVASSEGGNHASHASRARLALATAVSDTLAEMEAAEMNGAQPESMDEAKILHTRWAILEMARAAFAEDRPADWGSVGR